MDTYVNTNLGERLKDYKIRLAQEHVLNIRSPKHHEDRFKEGWIPVTRYPYLPAMGRFNEDNSTFAKGIVQTLENAGEYDFSLESHPFIKLSGALKEICGNIPQDIERIMADRKFPELLLDRHAYDRNGKLDKLTVQWYIRKD